mmetsp:Transcript_7947/g.10614  ORF Transcript_7947/g.10614 Transcript_7947/m.10614 type:complete len:254 (-) Transcript_7947:168-929(-)
MVKIGSGVREEKVYSKRKGFRSDRNAKYLETQGTRKSKKNAIQPKEISFDSSSREEFLTGFHRRKNERRVNASMQKRRSHTKKIRTERKDRREAARQQYNEMMQHPIKPDFTFQPSGEVEHSKFLVGSSALVCNGRIIPTGEQTSSAPQEDGDEFLSEQRFGTVVVSTKSIDIDTFVSRPKLIEDNMKADYIESTGHTLNSFRGKRQYQTNRKDKANSFSNKKYVQSELTRLKRLKAHGRCSKRNKKLSRKKK